MIIPLFVGIDPRESIGLHTFCQSVWSRASKTVAITPISGPTDGTNAFTLARFRIPEMVSYHGWAIWADGSDMICLADIAELWAMREIGKAVMVVKHNYKTKHPIKYLGQKNEDYPRKNWSSLMLINCNHFAWRHTEGLSGKSLHRFEFLPDTAIGELPVEWNWLDEFGPNDSAKIIHHTIGLPVWRPYDQWWCADQWRNELAAANSYQAWEGEGSDECATALKSGASAPEN